MVSPGQDRLKAMEEAGRFTLYAGDCRDVLASFPECSADAVVTDPPYELGFMAKAWDGAGVAYSAPTWAAVLRVLKPGGHLVAFGAPRTYHRLTCAIEDAGFEIRDSLMWIFGSGFPKSLAIDKALDKTAGAEREIVGQWKPTGTARIKGSIGARTSAAEDAYETSELRTSLPITMPATELARQWEGWGTALKPAYEPIVLARKPLIGTVAATVTAYGTGGLNIDGCRIGTGDDLNGGRYSEHGQGEADGSAYGSGINLRTPGAYTQPLGRWPANVLLDTEAAALLDQMSGERPGAVSSGSSGLNNGYDGGWGKHDQAASYGDHGGASRFFYTAKASRSEREFGLDDLDSIRRSDGREKDIENPRLRTNERRNDHPTVKPLDLMRWLCRLITPSGGTVLDPFLGSGSTGMAALDEGFRFIGIDLDEHYIEIAKRRIARRHLIETMPQADVGQGRLL